MTRPAPHAVGWADQILAVLAHADRPLSTDEIGRRARVVLPGPKPLQFRPAGNPSGATYRILVRLVGSGYATRTDTPEARSATWAASAELRTIEAEGVAILAEMWRRPTVEPRNPPPPIA
jgi:hypothetical protein